MKSKKLKITKREFETFWDEVLGKDWYIEEGECPEDDDDDDDVFDLSDLAIQWQGDGSEPKLHGALKTLKGIEPCMAFAPLFRKWEQAQTHVQIVATFVVPKDQADAVRKQIVSLGGEVKSNG